MSMRKVRNLAFMMLVAIAAIAFQTEPLQASYDICRWNSDCNEVHNLCDNSCQGPPVLWGIDENQSYCFTEPDPYEDGEWTCEHCVCLITP
jgi:hypothetical protein